MPLIEIVFASVVIGLWSWLFTETLTKGNHIFAWVGDMVDGRDPRGKVEALLFQYARCPICHAGAVGLAYVVLMFIFVYQWRMGFFFSVPILAMSVAKVMSAKY